MNEEPSAAAVPHGVLAGALQIVGRRHTRTWVVVIVLGIVVSVLEALAALAIFALFAAISGQGGGDRTSFVSSLLPDASPREQIVALCLGIMTFYVVRAVATLTHAYLQNRAAANEGMTLAVRLFDEYAHRDYAWHQQVNSATLIRNISESTEVVSRQVLLPLTTIIAEGSLVIAMVLVLLAAAPVATLGAIVVTAVAGGILVRLVQPRVERLGVFSQNAITDGLQTLNETLSGVREIKLRDCVDLFRDRYRHHRSVFARSMYVSSWLATVPRVALETIFILAIVVFLLFATTTADGAQAAIPVLGLFAYAVLRILPAVNRTLTAMTNLRFGRAGLENIFGDLTQPHERDRPPKSEGAPERMPFHSTIACRDLWFRYETSPDWIIKGVDLEIVAGECVGIVGSTGSGKTTLVDIVAGLLRPDEGLVTVDGVDIRDNLRGWQSQIGLVPQRLFLMDSAIRNNVAFGLRDEDIDDERVALAVQRAQLADFVAGLPQGLGTLVGEDGVRLSGGQRQRIAIARSLYHDPSVLIFDEATSALDNVTESQVMETLQSLRGSRTILVVAHRLSTVESCDRLLLMRSGSVVATGSFADLIDTSAEFRKMATS